MLTGIQLRPDPRLLVGFEHADDAGVFKLSEQTALIQTVDFFTPMVDDPYLFGQIAAANALSDVYAMGGQPLTAMNIVCFPDCLDVSVLRAIIKGGLTKIEEAGAVLVGGHSVDDQEPKYGLSVTGVIDPRKVVSNRGARTGDLLYMTKSLGTGIVTTAIKGEMAPEKLISDAVKSMAQLNKAAREVMMEVGINAATDITGFGLLGHVMEVAAGSKVQIELWAKRLPLFNGVEDLAAMGIIPAGAYANRDYLQGRVEVTGEVDRTRLDLMYAPETSGGLLMAVDPGRSRELERVAGNKEVLLTLVGQVTQAGPGHIKVVKG